MNEAPADTVDAVRRERDLYRATLVRIATAESGAWGVIASDALRQAASLKEERRAD